MSINKFTLAVSPINCCRLMSGLLWLTSVGGGITCMILSQISTNFEYADSMASLVGLLYILFALVFFLLFCIGNLLADQKGLDGDVQPASRRTIGNGLYAAFFYVVFHICGIIIYGCLGGNSWSGIYTT